MKKNPVGRPRGDKQTEVIRVDITRWSMLRKVEKLDEYEYARIVQLMHEIEIDRKS